MRVDGGTTFVVGSAARGHTNEDYGVKVYSLVASQAHATSARKPDDISFIDHSMAQCNKYFASDARSTDPRCP